MSSSIETANEIEIVFDRIGPTCLKNANGEFGVLWYSKFSNEPYAVVPRALCINPLNVTNVKIDREFVFSSVDAIVDAGWTLD